MEFANRCRGQYVGGAGGIQGRALAQSTEKLRIEALDVGECSIARGRRLQTRRHHVITVRTPVFLRPTAQPCESKVPRRRAPLRQARLPIPRVDCARGRRIDPLEPRLPSFSAFWASPRDINVDGRSPKDQSSEARHADREAEDPCIDGHLRQSRDIEWERLPVKSFDRNDRENIPRARPSSPAARLSVRNWRTSRMRVAPIADLIATSRSRAAALANMRFATLMQAISKSRLTATIRHRAQDGRIRQFRCAEESHGRSNLCWWRRSLFAFGR